MALGQRLLVFPTVLFAIPGMPSVLFRFGLLTLPTRAGVFHRGLKSEEAAQSRSIVGRLTRWKRGR